MASIKDFLSYEYSGEVTEYKVTDEGKKWGGRRASQDYPYAVVRDVQAVTRLATTVCEEWERNLEKPKIYNTNPKFDPNVRVMQGWTNSLPNTKRLFVNGFVGGYMDALKILDETEARKRPQPQPQPAAPPATPSNIATYKGATITLKDVKHNADECVYLLEVSDPNYIEPHEEEWVLHLGEVIAAPPSLSYGASSGTIASASAGSYSAPQSTSGTPQKPRRVTSSHFRKPQ